MTIESYLETKTRVSIRVAKVFNENNDVYVVSVDDTQHLYYQKYEWWTKAARAATRMIVKELGLEESQVTKVQTGGPDGDLGSNEILLSSDKTIAVIDGSGVLADPEGINRAELIRLAKLRVPVAHFDKSKLGKDGYLVTVEDQDVTLPSE